MTNAAASALSRSSTVAVGPASRSHHTYRTLSLQTLQRPSSSRHQHDGMHGDTAHLLKGLPRAETQSNADSALHKHTLSPHTTYTHHASTHALTRKSGCRQTAFTGIGRYTHPTRAYPRPAIVSAQSWDCSCCTHSSAHTPQTHKVSCIQQIKPCCCKRT